jgi:hypothetical protein
VVRGNCSFGMFSNYPENVDDALRQRAGARWLVDGPQSLEDYIDIFALLAGKNHSIPLGSHDLFANQEIKQAVARSYDGHDRPQEEGLLAVWERFDEGAWARSGPSPISAPICIASSWPNRVLPAGRSRTSPTRSRCGRWTSICRTSGSRRRKPSCTSPMTRRKR